MSVLAASGNLHDGTLIVPEIDVRRFYSGRDRDRSSDRSCLQEVAKEEESERTFLQEGSPNLTSLNAHRC
jgi:hypothetical protein